jgi:predicted RNA-binding Zn-ribbon protein involved in translation (DUF1610 family)
MPNVDVTLAAAPSEAAHRFPCPLCGTQLDLRQSRAKKPYCVCDSCGVQLFFRGKNGITRLRRLLEAHDRLVGGPTPIVTPAIFVFDRLEQLRVQKTELLRRRPLIFTDDDLEHTIEAVEREMARLQSVLAQMAGGGKT